MSGGVSREPSPPIPILTRSFIQLLPEERLRLLEPPDLGEAGFLVFVARGFAVLLLDPALPDAFWRLVERLVKRLVAVLSVALLAVVLRIELLVDLLVLLCLVLLLESPPSSRQGLALVV